MNKAMHHLKTIKIQLNCNRHVTRKNDVGNTSLQLAFKL